MDDHTHHHDGQCYCGAVKVTVKSDPVFTAYCHCESCRTWHAAPIASLCAWQDENVTITGETVVSTRNDQTQRTSCAKCGGGVLTTKPGLGWKVVYPMTLEKSDFKYQPGMHIFYSERVMDVCDGLPKFSDVPAEAGGSGTMIDDPATTAWVR